jgi:DNA-binding transcriptional MocR family regulator
MWIELPEAFDAVRLNTELRELNMQVAVGSLFSASGKYRNCLRLNYGLPMNEHTEQAIAQLGAAVERAMLACSHESVHTSSLIT